MANMKVVDTSITIKTWNSRRVVTFRDVDAIHQKPEGSARKRFNSNKKRFILGEDYFVVKPQDIENTDNNGNTNPKTRANTQMSVSRTSDQTLINTGLDGILNPRGLTLLTESGYLMLVKVFDDDLSWEVQRKLVSSYFRGKDAVQQIEKLRAENKDLKWKIQRYQSLAESKRRAELEQKPHSNYTAWIGTTFSKLKILQDYLSWRDDKPIDLKRVMAEVFKELEKKYEGVHVQDYVDKYLTEHPAQNNVYAINAIAEYKDGREMMDTVIDGLLARYGLSMADSITLFDQKEAA